MRFRRRFLLALVAALALQLGMAWAQPPEPEAPPEYVVRPASVSGGILIEASGVAGEATYERRLFEVGAWSFSVLTTGRLRVLDPFGADPVFSATLVAGAAATYCDPGFCLQAALRYRVVAAVGAPIAQGWDFAITFAVELGELVPASP